MDCSKFGNVGSFIRTVIVDTGTIPVLFRRFVYVKTTNYSATSLPRFAVFAARDIKAGEEIVFHRYINA